MKNEKSRESRVYIPINESKDLETRLLLIKINCVTLLLLITTISNLNNIPFFGVLCFFEVFLLLFAAFGVCDLLHAYGPPYW